MGNRKKKRFVFLRKTVWLLFCSIVFGCGASITFYMVNEFLVKESEAEKLTNIVIEAGNIAEGMTDIEELSLRVEEEHIADATGESVENTKVESEENLIYASQSLDVSGIAQSALPSIVSITNISVQEVQNYFNRFGRNGRGSMQMEETTSCGSGILISQDEEQLYIVTNYHVIEDATTVSVTFVDNETYEASLCGTDSNRDLAVISVALESISEDTLSQITVVEIGDSELLNVGEQVVAIGNALGYGQSVTTGIVSALNRSISTDSSDSTVTYIQTDAAINPGNSGGALLNMAGQLIGINTAKLSSTEIEGMGYAIPITEVWEIISELMEQISELQMQTNSSQDQSPIDSDLPSGAQPPSGQMSPGQIPQGEKTVPDNGRIPNMSGQIRF